MYHSQEGLCKLYPPIPPLWRPGPPVFLGSQSCDPAAWLWERQLLAGPSRTKTNTKTLLHTLTKYTNSPVQTSQSSPPSLSPAHSPPNSSTSVQSPHYESPSVKHTNIQQSIYSTAHTYIPQATYWTSGCLPGGWCLC